MTTISKNYILKTYKKDPKYFYRTILRKYPQEYKELAEKYESSVAGLYTIVYGEQTMICSCGNRKKFKTFRDGFQDFCCHKCYTNAEAPKEKRKKTTLKNHGVEHVSQSNEVRKKASETMLELYGVEHALQNKELSEKRVESFKKNNDIQKVIEKRKRTSLTLYGVAHPSQSLHVKNMRAETCIEKFGVDTPLRLQSTIEISKKKRKTFFFDKLIMRCLETDLIPLFSLDEFVSVATAHPWVCKKCNSEFRAHLDDGILPKCPVCYPRYDGASKGESELRDFISSLVHVEYSKKDIISPREIDIFIPSLNLAFEYNGLYWHSEAKVGKTYHLEKTQKCAENSIRLVHIFESEWLINKEIVKSRIKSILGLSDSKFYARKCKISVISKHQHDLFMDMNHIQGACPSKYRYGLYYNEELVAAISFGKSRYSKAEQERYANKVNYPRPKEAWASKSLTWIFSRFIDS